MIPVRKSKSINDLGVSLCSLGCDCIVQGDTVRFVHYLITIIKRDDDLYHTGCSFCVFRATMLKRMLEELDQAKVETGLENALWFRHCRV